LQYLDSARFTATESLVPDDNSDFPFHAPLLRRVAKNFVQSRGMNWYKLSDLTAEIRSFRECLRGHVDVVQFLDGEHSAQFLPRLVRRLGPRRVALVATYHQPPDVLSGLVREQVVRALDYVTLVAEEQRSFFSKLLPPDRVVVIPHGVE
jgi:hypothetical protein